MPNRTRRVRDVSRGRSWDDEEEELEEAIPGTIMWEANISGPAHALSRKTAGRSVPREGAARGLRIRQLLPFATNLL